MKHVNRYVPFYYLFIFNLLTSEIFESLSKAAGGVLPTVLRTSFRMVVFGKKLFVPSPQKDYYIKLTCHNLMKDTKRPMCPSCASDPDMLRCNRKEHMSNKIIFEALQAAATSTSKSDMTRHQSPLNSMRLENH